MTVLDHTTEHGTYDALPARPCDEPPRGATHAVFHDDGYLAGFASATCAWDCRGHYLRSVTTLAAAVRTVAERDDGGMPSQRSHQHPGDTGRDREREQFNAALATGDPDVIATAQRAALDAVHDRIMTDDGYQARTRFEPVDCSGVYDGAGHVYSDADPGL